MKLVTGILTLILAMCISGVAAYFSVVGLAAIFSATAIAVIVMGCSLEAGKLVAAGWLHQNWENPRVSKLHKGYMVAAVVALMFITALGIYGFLAKGHLAQQTPLAPIELTIAQKQSDIDFTNQDAKAQQVRLSQLDAAVNSMIGGDKASQALKFRAKQAAERTEIQNAIQADNAKVQKISQDLVPLKLQVNDVETKLGPVKYVADLFGIKDTEGAVRIIILVLMFAFDPLAVTLVLSSAISIGDGLQEIEEKRKRSIETKPAVEIETVPESKDPVDAESELVDDAVILSPVAETEGPLDLKSDTNSNLLVELEEHVQSTPPVLIRSDTAILLDILERKPELLQSIVEAVKEEHNKTPEPSTSAHNTVSENSNKSGSWLSN